MPFNMRAVRVADFAPPSAALDAQIDAISAAGSSAIFDTVAVALTSPVASDRRQLVVLFTDGKDSTSIITSDTLIDVARRTTPTVAVVLGAAVDGGVFASRPAIDPAYRQVYDRLAAETGGVVAQVSSDNRLDLTFQRVLGEFRSSYVLHFAPKGVPRGGAHTLAVRLTRPGTFDIRSRAGYVVR
jgi:hypothetical protein